MNVETSAITTTAPRPQTMDMTFQRGMLKTLGINLYANIGKVLVEFIANAYDGDAKKIDITLPVERIAKARKQLSDARRSKAAADSVTASENESKPSFDSLLATLPEDIEIVIADDGHGMSWEEVKDKFLPLNRQRRLDRQGRETSLKSPGGRFVMGRKGVGKLAGFGAAEKVVLRTKRAGDTYATIITMTDSNLEHEQAQTQIPIPVRYEDGLPIEEQGTTIVLSKLKADAFKASAKTISDGIASAFFAIRSEEFLIRINEEPITQSIPDYEFVFPETLILDQIKSGDMADDTFAVPEIGSIPFRYYIGFRKRSEHLSAGKRGARIYCNNRLAAGPTLFNLGTGMHSFHSADYMECIVEANELDRGSVDLISTSRTQLQEGNEIFEALQEKIGSLMRAAIAKHGAFRERIASAEIDNDPKGQIIKRSVEQLPTRTRKAATRLLTTIAAQYGVGTEAFEELAPIIMNSVNATEVLAKLVTTGTKPETVTSILSQLRELSEIELRDVLKLYRGRRGGISKIQALQKTGHELWKKKGLEKDLHQLLKDNPWLIRPEFSTYVTSDERINTVASKLAQHLRVDQFARIIDGGEVDNTRPDLVFLMSDRGSEGPFVIKVVELKSPTIPLTIDHYRQLEDYISTIERWCSSELKRTIAIHGYLIGEMPADNTTVQAELSLLSRFQKAGPDSQIRIVGLTQLINDAWNVHIDAIKAIESELDDDDDGDDTYAAAKMGGEQSELILSEPVAESSAP
ncbi:ATP-binding protein [Rhizobium leguminosarum]|uniref:ATP-binding protein n=1 Tax=Rhizobium leguminosarum TaxID=384 RepID=UPI003F9BF84A